MKEDGDSLTKSARHGFDATFSSKETYDKMFSDFASEINQFIDTFTSQKDSFDRYFSRTTLMRSVFYPVAFVILASAIVCLILFTFVFAKKAKYSKCSRFSAASCCFFLTFFALVINAAALATMVGSTALATGCYGVRKGMDDQGYKNSIPERFHKILDSCIYLNSTGAVSKFIEDSETFNNMQTMLANFTRPYESLNPEPSIPGSKTLNGYLSTYFADLQSFSKPIFTKSEGEEPLNFVQTENGIPAASGGIDCNQDRISLNSNSCPNGFSALSNPVLDPHQSHPSGNTCLVIPEWLF